ncbi:hypothetical protein ABZS88_45310 [Streptomyces sp. NPDC005480]|uniref:hypothetical protein n=1 Tax=Streptomyces sp. NPDC005480 TaxID=3154880 RepID=UPI0033B9A6B8
MRELTNLGWPVTPFGSITRPVKKPAKWLTAISLLWGEAEGPVLMGAAAVFMRIHRTRSLPICAELANFGYRVLTRMPRARRRRSPGSSTRCSYRRAVKRK